jgi:hypothetical protein
MAWFWCLEHKTVEEGNGCGSSSRIGPVATREEAASAMERIREREEQQKARDVEEERKHGRRREWF